MGRRVGVMSRQWIPLAVLASIPLVASPAVGSAVPYPAHGLPAVSFVLQVSPRHAARLPTRLVARGSLTFPKAPPGPCRFGPPGAAARPVVRIRLQARQTPLLGRSVT